MSVLRPEDNVDNDTIVLNKHSVLKKISTGKGRLDGWAYRTEQQIWTWGNREKNLVRGIVKYLRLEPQDNKMKVS